VPKNVTRRGVVGVLLLTLAAACRQTASPSHPLDPLTASEIRATEAVLNARGLLGGGTRVMLLDLREPPKADVLAGRATPREAFVVLYDAAHNTTSEAIVDVAARALRSSRVVPGVEPALDGVDAAVTETLVRKNDGWRAALARRGISNPSNVVVFAWPAGQFGAEDIAQGRLVRAVAYVRAAKENEMARPIEGLVALVDLSGQRVIQVDDDGVAPVPDAAIERDAWRPLARPTTPEPAPLPWSAVPRSLVGPRVDGHAVSWRRWRFHVALRPREGLVLYGIGFDDGTRVRSVMYRASLSEMVVPYGDPGAGWYFRNSFDVGEIGMGPGAAALEPGVDCPVSATLLDATIATDRGAPRTLPRAIAVYERDGGLAWKHGRDARRAHELVVFSVSRLGNYDYGFEWSFHEDGTIAHRVLLTGVMTPKALAPHAGHDSLANAVAPGIAAVHHQHFFNYRLDLDVDGATPNQIEETETHALAAGPGNARGGGFAMQKRVLATEQLARRSLDMHTGRRWRVVNPAATGGLAEPTGYELIPGTNADPFAAEGSPLRRRAGFLDAAVWATAYADSERYAAGDYPNQSSGGDGLVRWTAADRALTGGDVVLWYTLGITHNPRPEDWPVMPVHEAGFRLSPVGFFNRNPVLDRQ
jgi:primary-amine oxidase